MGLSRSTAVRWAAIALGLVVVIVVIWRYDAHRDAREPTWDPAATALDQRPLRVWYDDKEYQPYLGTIAAALGAWNERAGCQAVVRTRDRSEARLIIRPDDGTKCGRASDDEKAPMFTDWCANEVDIVTRRLDDVAEALPEFVHEVGHGFGLAHQSTGAMARAVMAAQVDGPPEMLQISASDVSAVRARFCR